MTNFAIKVVTGIVLAVFISLMLTCGVELSQATTTGQPNGLGVVIDKPRPNTVSIGTILDGAIVADKDGREGTVLRIHPIGTYALYDESLTFCGDQTVAIANPDGRIKQGDLVFIYRRQASRLLDGIPCYELRSVRALLPEKPRFE